MEKKLIAFADTIQQYTGSSDVIVTECDKLNNIGAIGHLELLKVDLIFDGIDRESIQLVSKSSPNSVIKRRLFHQLDFFRREIEFYEAAQSIHTLAVPKYYGATIDDVTGKSFIVNEFISSTSQFNLNDGVLFDYSKWVLAHLNKLHSNLNTHLPDTSFYRYIASQKEAINQNLFSLFRKCTKKFFKTYSSFSNNKTLDKRVLEEIYLLTNLGPQWLEYNQNATSLIHGDLHCNNMLQSDKSPYNLYFIDWQTCRIGYIEMDLSYFLISSVEPDTRRRLEKDLERYYSSERKHCESVNLTHYRIGGILNLITIVIGIALKQEKFTDPNILSIQLNRLEQFFLDHRPVQALEAINTA